MDTKHIKDMNGGTKMSNIFTKKWEDEPGHGSTTKNNQGKTGKDFPG